MISHYHIIQFVGLFAIIINVFAGWIDLWLMFILAGVIPGIYSLMCITIKIIRVVKTGRYE